MALFKIPAPTWFLAFILAIGLAGLAGVRDVGATLSALTPTSQTANLGGSAPLSFTAQDDLPGTNSKVTGRINFGPGQFTSGSFAGGTGGASCPGTVSTTNATNDTITFEASCVNGIDGDVVSQPQTANVSVGCNATGGGGTISVTFNQNDGSQGQSATISCSGTGTSNGTTNFGLLTLTATPNQIPCGGGSTTIHAAAIDGFGHDLGFTFFNFSTDKGLLTQNVQNAGTLATPTAGSLGNQNATLYLGPGQLSATVTATTVDTSGAVRTGTVTVYQACNGFASVVVTAQPNVIPCAGQSVITATARDSNGHVVPGVGYHFTVDSGSLLPPAPNDATAEGNTAVLTMLPGQTSATVKVSVGTTVGDVAGQVTVQQFCSPDTNAPGKVTLLPSATSLQCGGSLFIGASVRDSKNSMAADGTQVEFIATNGGFGAPPPPTTGTPTSGSSSSSSLSSDVTATTTSGSLHVIYNAPAGYAGPVRITAGSGASFTPLDLTVTCAGFAPSGVAGASGGAAVGGRISPPNTGDGGLR